MYDTRAQVCDTGSFYGPDGMDGGAPSGPHPEYGPAEPAPYDPYAGAFNPPAPHVKTEAPEGAEDVSIWTRLARAASWGGVATEQGVEEVKEGKGVVDQATEWAKLEWSKVKPGSAHARSQRLVAQGADREARAMRSAATKAGTRAFMVDKGLAAVGAAATAADQYADTSAQTEAGAQWDAGLAAAVNFGGSFCEHGLPGLEGATGLKGLMGRTGVVGAADTLFSLGMEKLFGVKKAGLGDMDGSAVHAVTAMGEDLAMNDNKATGDFHARSLKGDMGPVFRVASEAGDYYANHDVIADLHSAIFE